MGDALSVPFIVSCCKGLAVGDKTPKQSPVQVFQFASNFVGYNHFPSVLRVKDAYFQVQLYSKLPD